MTGRGRPRGEVTSLNTQTQRVFRAKPERDAACDALDRARRKEIRKKQAEERAKAATKLAADEVASAKTKFVTATHKLEAEQKQEDKMKQMIVKNKEPRSQGAEEPSQRQEQRGEPIKGRSRRSSARVSQVSQVVKTNGSRIKRRFSGDSDSD